MTEVRGADDAVLLRIVVHGPPLAGKTTTARALGRALGQPVASPEEDADGRTTLFDWVEYVGGRFDGRPIRTQLVTVPGHDPIRSAHLLAAADVVLFVADATASGITASAALLDAVRAELQDRVPPVGLLVQANKRDHADALPADQLTRRLHLAEGDVIVETVASDGDGVRQAFVYAVRIGLARVAARAEAPGGAHLGDPAALARELRAIPALPPSLADAPQVWHAPPGVRPAGVPA